MTKRVSHCLLLVVRFYADFLQKQKLNSKVVDILKVDKQMDYMPYDRKQIIAENLLLQSDQLNSVELANAIFGHLLAQFKYV